MPDFWYSALTESGTVQEGTITAPSELVLEEQLRATQISFDVEAQIRGSSSVNRP